MDRKSEYRKLLLDPRWQKKRLEILQRDNWTCRSCKTTEKTLHVHHKYYIRGHKPWEYSNECFAVLCEDCHREEAEQLPVVIEGIISTLRQQSMSGDMYILLEAMIEHNFDPCAAAKKVING